MANFVSWILISFSLLCPAQAHEVGRGGDASRCRVSPAQPWGLAIDCSNLGLDSVPANLQRNNVTKLYLRNNTITNFTRANFAGFVDLDTLDLSDNNVIGIRPNPVNSYIEDSSFEQLKSLQTLNMAGNNFVYIPAGLFRNMTNLITLDLSENGWLELSNQTFSGLSALQHLNLADWGEFTGYNHEFEPLVSLTELNLRRCGINIAAIKASLGTLKRLTEIDLGNNDIEEIPAHTLSNLFPGLEVLQLDSCSIAKLENDSFSGLFHLRELDLSNNDITSLPSFSDLHALETLVLGYNNLSMVNWKDFKFLYSVSNLNMMSNNIARMTPGMFSDMSLRELILAHNEINSVPENAFLGCQSLETLDLSYNNIATLSVGSFNGMSSLQVLNLTHNSLSTLSEAMLVNLAQLKTLNLSDNVVKNIGGVLKAMSHLENLDLRSNRIVTVSKSDVALLKSSPIDTFAAGDNTYNCTCDLLYFVMWFIGDKDRILDEPTSYRCWHSKEDIVADVLPSCQEHLSLYIIISVPVSAALLVSLAIALGYYHRWTLRLQWYKLRYRHYQILESMADYDPSIEFDAFVSYNSQDIDFVENQLLPNLEQAEDEDNFRLAVDFREFTPGHAIVDEIVTFIEKSRKTLLLVNNNFVDSNWTMFEYEMSRSKLATRRNAIIVVLLEDISSRMRELPKSLNVLLRDNLYIEWTVEPAGQDIFWKKLRYALRKSDIIRRTEM